MIKVAEVIALISRTSGTNDKLYLLKKNENVPGLKEILRFIYNPYCKTGISSKKLEKAKGLYAHTAGVTWEDAVAYFSEHRTGSDADLAFANSFIESTQNDAKWLAEAIVTQDLKIGVSATSLNKVYGADFIPKIGCMLGKLYGDVGPTKTKWPCIVTEKLDGIRRILVKENGTVRCYSRSGHEDEGLVDIVREASYLPDNTLYDGELLADGVFKDSIAQRQATNSIANSGGVKVGLTFNVFDMIPLDEFYKGASERNAKLRKTLLAATLMDDSLRVLEPEKAYSLIQAFGIHQTLKAIRPVPILGIVKSMDEVEPIVNEIWSRGGEGVMLNTVDGLYEIKRSSNLLKVKHTEEHVLKVIDMQEGTGKFDGMMGALVVDYNGVRLGVGSGFTDAERKKIWNNKDAYIGRNIEIDTFGESTNVLGEKSLNCPIFKRFVGEEE
jgi:DNA ligase-1